MPKAIIVMGVSGSGKTTLAEALAKRLGFLFLEGDTLHPRSNVEKMRAGTPLNDADRLPWLQAIGHAIADHVQAGRSVVAACSALKRAYRGTLDEAAGMRLSFVLLDVPADVLAQRMAHRPGHFMPASLLQSQLATLERPGAGENALVLDGTRPAAELVEAVIAHFRPGEP
jgi:gluconokinase